MSYWYNPFVFKIFIILFDQIINEIAKSYSKHATVEEKKHAHYAFKSQITNKKSSIDFLLGTNKEKGSSSNVGWGIRWSEYSN